MLARESVLLIAPIMVAWIVFGARGPDRVGRRLAWSATFAGVILALILPFTLKNYLAGDDLVLLNSTGGENLFMGNHRHADGTWKLPPIGARERADTPPALRLAFREAAERATGRSLKPSEVSSFWSGRTLEEIRADPLHWLRLEAKKFGLFWNAYEVWNNRSIDVSRRFSWVLRLPLVSFGLLAPFSLIGLASTGRRWRELAPVHATIVVYLATAMTFFVLSRYRLPGVVVLIPFAAFAAVDLFDRLRARDWVASGIRILALGGLAVLVHLPLANENRMHMAYYNLGNKYRELGRWDEAIDAYRDSLVESPNAISTWNNLALAYELGGRVEEGIAAWRRVGALAARSGDFRRIERATRHLQSLGADPDSAADREDSEGLAPGASSPN